MSWSVVIQTYDPVGTPHKDKLIKSNPDCRVFVSIGNALAGWERKTSWRNADRQMRDYWKENSNIIPGDRVAFIEWDVAVTCQLPEISPEGLTGASLKNSAPWMWWEEKERLGAIQGSAIGISPLAVLFWNRKALDAICDPKWDEIFNKDIFCELRTPSVVAACGFPVEEYSMPRVKAVQIGLVKAVPGIYHSIKS